MTNYSKFLNSSIQVGPNVSRKYRLGWAQFIKPGPVQRHSQHTAASHSWWEGQADVQGQSKREARKKFTRRRSLVPTQPAASLQTLLSYTHTHIAAGVTQGPTLALLPCSLTLFLSTSVPQHSVNIRCLLSTQQHRSVASLAAAVPHRAKRGEERNESGASLFPRATRPYTYWATENATFVRISPDPPHINLVSITSAIMSLSPLLNQQFDVCVCLTKAF